MLASSIVSYENNVKIGYNSAVFLKSDKLLRCLSGSSSFIGCHTDFTYSKKDTQKSKAPTKNEKKIKELRSFSINKSKVKSKILALAHLKQSKKFLAFITVSFPQSFPDKNAISVLNNVLTNVRQGSLKFNYLWVAERQQNSTIHFHMVCNRFFNIRVLNHKFANAVQRELVKDNLTDINFDKHKYNGVDVKQVRNIGSIAAYITKYVSKSDDVFNVRCWGSDSITSKLFTHVSELAGALRFDKRNLVFDTRGIVKIYENDWCYITWFKSLFSGPLIKKLQAINNKIFADLAEANIFTAPNIIADTGINNIIQSKYKQSKIKYEYVY